MNINNTNLNIIGLMSGTSLDGINASIVCTNGSELKRYNINYISKYRNKTYDLLKKTIEGKKFKENFNELNDLITIDHYECIKKLLNSVNINIDLIGFHGQTIFHDPKKISIQLGNPQLLADMTKVNVVFNFRDNDIEDGGQGAPIAPIYHKLIIEQLSFKMPSCVINIGGISNISYWDGSKLLGFDTGTGNCLLDKFMQEKLNLPYDDKGKLGSMGKSDQEFIDIFFKDSYFKKSYPKSLDKLEFNDYYNTLIGKKLKNIDSLSTLSSITAQSIIRGIEILPKAPEAVLIIGGGMYNRSIIKPLKEKYNNKLFLGYEMNVPGEMIEAELMGFLAARSLYGMPITFPLTTGIKKAKTGGKIYFPK
ncbi:anhydro-N-acetylmuramic acid kinase [bacterium]|nr:anhydro-N-acetylmuramic acid kinase [bacterium]